MTATLKLPTPDLRPGMIVRCYGSRFRLTGWATDEAAAREYAERYSRIAPPRGVSVEEWRAEQHRWASLRALDAEYLGPVDPSREHGEAIPPHWRRGFVVQGNHLAYWVVEA